MTNRTGRKREKLQFFFPLLAVTAGLLLAIVLWNVVGIDNIEKPEYNPRAAICQVIDKNTHQLKMVYCYPEATSLHFGMEVYRATQFWFIGVFAYCVILAVTIFTCWRIADGSLRGYPTGYHEKIYAGVTGLCVLVGIYFWGKGVPLEEYLEPANTALKLNAPIIADRLNVMAAIALTIVVMTACTILIWPRENLEGEKDSRIKQAKVRLTEQTNRLNVLLYLSATMLVARVIEVTALYSLATKFVPAAETEVAALVAQTVAIHNGAIFSILLALMYLSTAFTLRARIRNLSIEAIGHTTEEDRKQWLVKNGLNIGIAQKFLRLFVVLAPLLPGTMEMLIPVFSFAA